MSDLRKYLRILETYQEESSTFTHDGVEYDLNTLLAMSNHLPVAHFAVEDLEWILGETTVEPSRIRAADVTCPILVAVYEDKWVVLDGAHRLAKALMTGVPFIAGKVIDTSMLIICKI